MAEIDDHMAVASTGILQDPLEVTRWDGGAVCGSERAGFFASLGLLGTGGLPGAPTTDSGGLTKFGTQLSTE